MGAISGVRSYCVGIYLGFSQVYLLCGTQILTLAPSSSVLSFCEAGRPFTAIFRIAIKKMGCSLILPTRAFVSVVQSPGQTRFDVCSRSWFKMGNG